MAGNKSERSRLSLEEIATELDSMLIKVEKIEKLIAPGEDKVKL